MSKISKVSKSLLVLLFAFAGSQAQAQEPVVNTDNLESVSAVDPYRIVWVSSGEVRTQKFLTSEYDFQPPRARDWIRRVRVVGTRNEVHISRAEVVLRNGQVFPLDRLEGYLPEGRARVVRFGFQGERIEEVRIWATSGLIGSRGRFRVDMAVDR